jgi:glycopeptide antibiotics resistance protein
MVLLRCIYESKGESMKIFVRIILSTLFCLYLLILSKLILFKFPITNEFGYNQYLWNSSNFIPFKTIVYYLFLSTDINFNIRVENLVGNIIGFVPFGFILPMLSKKLHNLKAVLILTFSLSLSYEALQISLGLGSFDVDDLILNTLGGVIGYLLIKFIYLIFISQKKRIRVALLRGIEE